MLPARLGVALAILFALNTASAESVRLTTGHWPPYLDAHSVDGGFAAQIIREAFSTQGMDVDFDFLPWSRALMLAGTDAYDGTAIWSCTAMRVRMFLFSAPILPFRFVFYHRADEAFHWRNTHDLQAKIIGLTQDYAYGRALTQAARKGIVRTDMTTSDEANFRKLAAGRIDLFPMDPVVGDYMVRNELPVTLAGQIAFHPNPVREAAYHVLVNNKRKRAKSLMNSFNEGLMELRASGRLDDLLPDELPLPETNDVITSSHPKDTECLAKRDRGVS